MLKKAGFRSEVIKPLKVLLGKMYPKCLVPLFDQQENRINVKKTFVGLFYIPLVLLADLLGVFLSFSIGQLVYSAGVHVSN